MKQTAVEWLSQNFPDLGKYIPFGMSMELHAKFQQAKEMEKEQIIDAYAQGFIESEVMDKGAEQYYNETYGGNNE
jgi:hypothetical protein